MTFLSPSRFGDTPANPLPSAVKIARTLMWFQTVGLLVLGGIHVMSVQSLPGLSDKELAESTKQYQEPWTSQADVPYTAMWSQAIILLVLGAAVGFCAWRIATRDSRVRWVGIIAEGILAAIGIMTLLSFSCVVLFALPGIPVLVMLLRGQTRDWFAAGKADSAGSNGSAITTD